MTSTTRSSTPRQPPHPATPPRTEVLGTVLRSARRDGVPIRKSFVQQGRGRANTKPGPLAGLVRRGDVRALDAYLLLHAAASAAPWDCTWPSDTWVHLLDLTRSTTGGSTKAAVSKVFARLSKTHNLVEVARVGRRSSVVLLREDGTGAPYSRPVTKEDPWFTLPHSYFLKGYDTSLSLSAKAMLLVTLHLKDGAWLPSEYSREWFGISPTTARAGLAELIEQGLVAETRDYVPDLKSPTLWAEKVSYRRAGAMRVRKGRPSSTTATKGKTALIPPPKKAVRGGRGKTVLPRAGDASGSSRPSAPRGSKSRTNKPRES